jgi:hypothetical protein
LYNILYDVFFLAPPGRDAKRVYEMPGKSSKRSIEIAPVGFTVEINTIGIRGDRVRKHA